MSKFIIHRGDKIMVKTMWGGREWKKVEFVDDSGKPYIMEDVKLVGVGDNAIQYVQSCVEEHAAYFVGWIARCCWKVLQKEIYKDNK